MFYKLVIPYSDYFKYKIDNDIVLLLKALKQGYLITNQLFTLISDIENLLPFQINDMNNECYICENPYNRNNEFNLNTIEVKLQKQFEFKHTEQEILDLVKKEVIWRDKEREIHINNE